MQCRSRHDAFLAAVVDGISEVINVLILLAWRVALGPIDRYGSFNSVDPTSRESVTITIISCSV